MNDLNVHRYVISVLLPDRVAILRDVTSAVSSVSGNIDGISQTVVAGYFSGVFTATLPATVSVENLRRAVLSNLRGDSVALVVEPYVARAAVQTVPDGERYMATASGVDRVGILKAITTFLAERGINIEDWYVEFDGDRVTHVGEVTVPPRLDIKQLQEEFRHALSGVGLTGGIQHENIFRATYEVGPIAALLEGGAQ
jgi:predicted amino acid-binding ACT domain protein